jgi:hypothetical protein
MACGDSVPSESAQDEEQPVELLFVQDAKSVEFGEGTLTLRGVKPTTLYFSDRPHRIAGHVALDSLLATLEAESDLAEVNPNATLVILEGDQLQDVVMVLREAPRLEGDTLTFGNIEILAGDPPAVGGASALFVDSVGNPAQWRRPANPRGRFDPRGPADPR